MANRRGYYPVRPFFILAVNFSSEHVRRVMLVHVGVTDMEKRDLTIRISHDVVTPSALSSVHDTRRIPK